MLAAAVPVLQGVVAPSAAVQAAPRAATAAVRSPVYRGVNLSGAEFAHDAAHLPGVVDRDYRYPTANDLRFVAARGHRMVRLPVRWERVQPNLLGPLQADELRRILETVERAAALGLRVLVDVHNYARYIRSASEGGATLVLGDGQLTEDHLVDLWSRLSTALKGRSGVLGYGLMNEPHDLPGAPAVASPSASPAVRVFGFDDGPAPWSGEGGAALASSSAAGTVHTGGGSLQITRRLPSGQQYIRANGQPATALGPAAGRTLTARVLVPRGAPGDRWAARLEMMDAAYRWRPGPEVALTPGTWAKLVCTPDSATWTGNRGVGVQFSSYQGAAVDAVVYVDSVEQDDSGPLSAAPSEAAQWERTAQRCLDAIRANKDSTPVYVSGAVWSGAQSWARNHPRPWLLDPVRAVVYEAHYYFDRDNVGTYRHTFAEEEVDARSRGYASLKHRATSELGRFVEWCRTHGVQGFVGELGWENSRDTARWNAVGDALYAALDAAGMGAAYWGAGQWYGSTYNLSIYTGAPLSRRAAPASVVEAHPSRYL